MWLKKTGGLSEDEMRRVFNCGVGLAVIVAADDADEVLQALTDNNENALAFGRYSTSGGQTRRTGGIVG